MNKHTRSVSLIDGHIEETDVIKALECCKQGTAVDCKECPLYEDKGHTCITILSYKSLDLINRQQTQIKQLETIERLATNTIGKQSAEIEKLNVELVGMRGACESYKIHYDNAQAEIERLTEERDFYKAPSSLLAKGIEQIKSEAIKEFAEKIDQLFYRYAHILSHADCARKDYIKADDGTEIEIQSVWDVFTLKKYGIAEYEEMNRLQTNIELIEKGRLLAELKKDFRVLVKEMTEVSE